MATVTAAIELTDEQAAELMAWAGHYGMTAEAVLRDALQTGLDMRRIMFESDTAVGPLRPGVVDDDNPF